MYRYVVQQSDLDLLRQGMRVTYCKVELLNHEMEVVESLDGNLFNDNFSCSGESIVRRTITFDLIVSNGTFAIGRDKKIWIDRYVRVYYGVLAQRTQEVKWYLMGTFSFVDMTSSYSTTEKKISVTCSDMMCEFDGTKGGKLFGGDDATVTIEAGKSYGEVIEGLLNDSGIVNYEINDVDGFVVPYDIEWEAGTTVSAALTELKDLYGYWEFFFDEEGTFIWRKTSERYEEDVVLDDSIVNELVISENVSNSFNGVYNATEVWGMNLNLVDDDRYATECSGGTSASDNVYRIHFDLIESLDDLDNFTNIAIKVSGTRGQYIQINNLDPIPILNNAGDELLAKAYVKDTTYVFRYRRTATGSTEEVYYPNFCLLGQYQAYGYYEETDPNISYSIPNVGYRIVNVIQNDQLYSDEVCNSQAEYETFQTTAKKDTMSLQMMIIPFLEPNQKIKYSLSMADDRDEWVIKDYSWSIMSGVMNINLYRFVPYQKSVRDDYLCFTATQANTSINFALTEDSLANVEPPLFYYSYDKTTWQEYLFNTNVVLNNINDTVYFKGDNNSVSVVTVKDGGIITTHRAVRFRSSAPIKASGNIMSLIDSSCRSSTIPGPGCFFQLFRNEAKLITAPQLPATTLAPHCYYQMFANNDLLLYPPKLPSIEMEDSCYYGMFDGCTSLLEAPSLPARRLVDWCYAYMFNYCSSLTMPPELPANYMKVSCYTGMFRYSGITVAPKLPAISLSKRCYYQMFSYCSNIIVPPALPAKRLATECYAYMFEACSNIRISTEPSDLYCLSYRIPSAENGVDAQNATSHMFERTGGDNVETPDINTIYYVYDGHLFTPVYTAPSVRSLTYTGSNQSLAVAGSVVEGGTMMYAYTKRKAITEDVTFTSTIPVSKDAGDYYIWYKIVSNSALYKSIDPICVGSTEIKPVTITCTEPTVNFDLNYTGNPQALLVAGHVYGDFGEMEYVMNRNSLTAPSSGWSTSIPVATDIGEYCLWFRVVGDNNHRGIDATFLGAASIV